MKLFKLLRFKKKSKEMKVRILFSDKLYKAKKLKDMTKEEKDETFSPNSSFRDGFHGECIFVEPLSWADDPSDNAWRYMRNHEIEIIKEMESENEATV